MIQPLATDYNIICPVDEVNEISRNTNEGIIITPGDDNKGIKVFSDNRFTKITIDKNFTCENNNETFISTHILKDKLLKTTETLIKKVFVHKNDQGSMNVILREINIDRYNNQSVSEHKSIHIKLNENESLESRINSFLQNSAIPLLLN